MKGLLLKDFYLLTKYCKAAFFIALVFTASSCFYEGNSMFLFYPCIVTSILPVTLQAYDEREKWTAYCGALPYTRAELVSAKYIISLCMGFLMILLSGSVLFIVSLAAGDLSLEKLSIIVSTLLTLLTVVLISPAIILPFIFKFGIERGRIFYYVIVGAVCGLALGMDSAGVGDALLNGSLISVFITFEVVAIYGISWALSIHFYTKKEIA